MVLVGDVNKARGRALVVGTRGTELVVLEVGSF